MAFTSKIHDGPAGARSGRKDLQNLVNLSRAITLSYLQKGVRPQMPRAKTIAPMGTPPQIFPTLAAFAPNRLIKWLYEYLSHRIGSRHPFQAYLASDADQGIYRFDDDDEVRIALAGDWGTGTDEAYRVAKCIQAFKPHYTIHLGDVYYVGAADEVDENFLGIKNPKNDYEPCLWPAGSRGSFALNGNHEMYALGYSYFDRMLPRLGPIVNSQPLGQRASYFCLENRHWRIIALDTGYNSIGWPVIEDFMQPSCALGPDQIRWLREVIRPGDDQRGIIILTHHQYYSRYENCYPAPARQLAAFISRPVLWFWGHEHRLAVYEEPAARDGIRVIGRCIGHGGMPVELPPKEPKHIQYAVEFVDRRLYPNDEGLTVGYNGYAQLSMQSNRAMVRYRDLEGREIFYEEWKTGNGILKRIQHGVGG